MFHFNFFVYFMFFLTCSGCLRICNYFVNVYRDKNCKSFKNSKPKCHNLLLFILLSNYTLNYYFKNKKKFKYKIIFRIFGMIILKYNEINNYKNKIKTIEIH